MLAVILPRLREWVRWLSVSTATPPSKTVLFHVISTTYGISWTQKQPRYSSLTVSLPPRFLVNEVSHQVRGKSSVSLPL